VIAASWPPTRARLRCTVPPVPPRRSCSLIQLGRRHPRCHPLIWRPPTLCPALVQELALGGSGGLAPIGRTMVPLVCPHRPTRTSS
jgi:hypothetical protein